MNQCVLHVIWGGNLSFSLAVQHLKGHLVITSSFRGLSESWAKDKSKRDCERLFVLYGSPPHTHTRVCARMHTQVFFSCIPFSGFFSASFFQEYNPFHHGSAVQTPDHREAVLKVHVCILSLG